MPLLKYRCESCDQVFEALVSPAKADDVRCETCGSAVQRAYVGKCLFGMSGSSAGRDCGCSGDCGGCGGGCSYHGSH